MNGPSDVFSTSETPRRGLLKGAVGILIGAISVLLAWPLIGSLVGPVYRRQARRFFPVGRLADIPIGQPTRLSFPFVSIEAYVREQLTRDVWVIRHSETDLTVFSPICTHLSCRYDWNPRSKHFVCPCHGSVFELSGKVLAGPAPRPLDTLSFRIEQGELLVEWENFASGIARKVPV